METTTLQVFYTYSLSVLLGALMGLERERHKTHLAGLRTFILVTLFGSICGHISEMSTGRWVVLAGTLAITVLSAMVLALRFREDGSAGLTTSIALLVAYGIGVLVTLEQTVAAVALSLATTVILYFKPQLHEFTHNLGERDIHAIFQFGLIAFIILPILPNHGYGPYAALNPYNIWLMVVMISAINLLGYVTLKFAGRRWGAPMLGILGGLVSSTATTLSFSRHAKEHPAFSLMGAVIVAVASTVVLVRMAVLVGIVNQSLLLPLALPLVAMFLGGLVPVFLLWSKTTRQESPTPEAKNPVEMKQALVFGLIYALVLLAVSAAQAVFGDKGVYVVALLSGLTDMDAITLSNARLAGTGTLAATQAVNSILIAYVSNLAFKLAMIGVIGTRQMFNGALLCFVCLAVPALLILV